MREESGGTRAFDIFAPAEASESQHREIRSSRNLTDLAEKLETIHPGHRNIREHDVEFFLCHDTQCFVSAGGGLNVSSANPQQFCEHACCILGIIDHQHGNT